MSYTPYSGSPDGPSAQNEPPTPNRRSSSGLVMVGLLAIGLLFGAVIWGTIATGQMADANPGFSATPNPAAGLPTVAAPPEAPKVGSRAPDFTLEDLNTGQPVTLSSLKGKPVWINFWATWCPPCKEEMPVMEKYYQQYKEKGLVIIGIDLQEPKADVLSYIQQGNYTWTFVIDPDGKLTNKYYVSGLPSHFFIDKDGIIQAIVIGGLKSSTTGQLRDVTPFLQKIMP